MKEVSEELKYKIVRSGSKGNCVIMNDIMIDCGVPFKLIKDELYNVRLLLITHIHSDHVTPSTLKRIKAMFPHILIAGNYEVNQVFGVDVITINNRVHDLVEHEITPFECFHDVVVQGFTFELNGESIIYATDTQNLTCAPSKKYDWLFLESNHDERKLKAIGATIKGYDAVAGGSRHMSTQVCKGFYYTHRRNESSRLLELHKSERFY